MTYSDEQICAFLDGELPQEQADAMRNDIATNEQLAERIEAFAMTDEKLKQTYAAIDEKPLPKAISDLLEIDNDESLTNASAQPGSSAHPNNLVKLPMRQRFQQWAPRIAACVTFAVGYSLATYTQPTATDSKDWQTALSQTQSGQTSPIANGILRVNFSFKSNQDAYCRQYSVRANTNASENIACRTSEGSWQEVAKIPVRQSAKPGEYSTASKTNVIDTVLDEMMESSTLTTEQETSLIHNNWNRQK